MAYAERFSADRAKCKVFSARPQSGRLWACFGVLAMWHWSRTATSLLAALILIAFAGVFAATAADWRRDWATLRNERHGFLIAYPSEVFQQLREPGTDEGRILSSRDGKAQLLVGAFINDDATTLQAYRDYLMQESYAGADIDYAPVRGKWFVISGTMGDQEFYERVSFTCGGQLINSWAMIYPKAERRFYNRVIEAVARTYSPGAGRTGQCD
jgi:hypothetical protein